MKKVHIRASRLLAVLGLLVAICAPLAAQGLETLSYDFEKNGTQGWGPRGDGVVVKALPEAAHSGSFGLSAANRSANWMGSAIGLASVLKPGAAYSFSAYMRLASAPGTPSSVKFTMEEKQGGKTNWIQVAAVEIKDDKWYKVSGTYSFASAMDGLSLYAESSSPSDVIYTDDIVIAMTSAPPPAVVKIQSDIKALKDDFKGYFAAGVCVNTENIKGEKGELVKKHFNSIVAENAMKPMYIQPKEGTFFWDEADAIVAFAKKNNMVIRYHTLQWHSQCPDWFFIDKDGKEMVNEKDPAKREANKKLLLSRLETHVKTVVNRYKDDIRSWDVVNEVIDESQADGMRQSKWYLIAGKDYVETAFRAARAASPRAKLFINDFNTHSPAKRDALKKLIVELRDKGVSIDGVGHQMHVRVFSPAINEIEDSIKLFGSMGLENHITELDMGVYNDDISVYNSISQDLMIHQAYRYKELFAAFKRLNKEISNVTFWGINDGASWLNGFPIKRLDAPLLFDDNLQAKLAYYGIVDPSKLPPQPALPKPKAEPKLGEAISGKANVDGKIEAAWNKAKTFDVSTFIGVGGTATAKGRVMWDENFLYVLMEVADPVLNSSAAAVHEKDSVEVFMDENNAKSLTYQADDGQYRVNYKNELSFGSNGESKGMLSATTLTKGGYVVEMAIPFRTIKGSAGAVIGFDLQVNDADASAKRVGIAKWNDATDESWRSMLNLGTLKLVK